MWRNGRFGVMGALLLGACGGGGGVTTTPPPITPAPAPAPTPTPTPTNYDTTEYEQSAASSAGALTAYNAGASGRGVTVAIVDSGIDLPSAQFAGRISPASTDVTGAGRGAQDTDGHGTSVAGVLAAARDNISIQGVAPEATILALKADQAGTCPKCSFYDGPIAAGVDAAVANGARVINLSLGGSAAGPTLLTAIQAATAKGIVVVIAAGNDATPQVDPLAASALTVANGSVIVAGAVDSNGALATFTDKAGTAQNSYLAALGVSVLSFKTGGVEYYFGGTSYSTPVIAGAAALLAQQFPNLTGPQIVNLLLSTADDAGAPGTDDQFGRGILNIAKAFAPQGTTSLAGSAIPVATTVNGTSGGAAGDALKCGTALSGVIVLDGYKRAYKLNLARTIGPAREAGLASALLSRSVNVGLGGGAHSLSFSLAPGAGDRPELGLAQQGLDAIGEGSGARAGLARATLWPGADIALGFGTRFDAIAEASAPGRAAFLVAPDAGLERATPLSTTRGVRFGQRLASWSLAVAAGASEAYVTHGLAPLQTNDWQVTAGRRLGRATLGVSLGGRDETGGLLGATFGPAFGIARAATTTLGLDGTLALAGGWRLGASARHGWTQATTGAGLVTGVDGVRSFGWRLDVARGGLLTSADSLALRLAQPMRVVDGAARLYLPTSYDYNTGIVGFSNRAASLTPSGTERDAEAVYARSFGWGSLATHLFWRGQPGHIAGAPDDTGAALTLDAAF